MTLAQAVAVAQATAPEATVAEVNVPTRGDEPVWRVGLKAPGEERVRIIQVFDGTGEAKATRGRPERPVAGPSGPPDEISPLVRRIHDGADTGIVWQMIIFVAGLAPVLLGISGVVMWLRRRARRRALRPGAA